MIRARHRYVASRRPIGPSGPDINANQEGRCGDSGQHDQVTGEVMWIEGNDLLIVRLRPSGLYQFFEVQPGRKFVIDGQPN